MSTYTHHVPMKLLAEADRPREKMRNRGQQSLTDAELVAILLGKGTRELSALALAQQLLLSAEQDLDRLGRFQIDEFTQLKGIGPVKAITLMAALELGRRRQLTQPSQRPQIKSSQDAFNLVGPLVADLPHEEFWILMLNRANRLIAQEKVSSGGIAGTVVDAKIIFRAALSRGASSLVLCHNHPSGNLRPSQNDLDITRKLKQAGKYIEIGVLDHLIVSHQGFYSFADEGLM